MLQYGAISCWIIPASLMVKQVFKKKEIGKLLYVSSISEIDIPIVYSNYKKWGLQSFGFVIFFFSFFWILLTNISIWPMVARMLAAKKDIGSRYMGVYVVCPVHYFPLQLLTYIAVRINKMKEWPHWTLSGKMANQSVKTSNNRFFLSWQVFPRKLRYWDFQNIIYNYLLYIVK